jgi:hypothetical protein
MKLTIYQQLACAGLLGARCDEFRILGSSLRTADPAFADEAPANCFTAQYVP